MEIVVIKVIDIYSIFSQFDIEIPRDDFDQVCGIELRFNNMMIKSSVVGNKIYELTDPMYQELNDGIANFDSEIKLFDNDFETKGPMVEGLSSKDASDRVNNKLYTLRLHPILNTNIFLDVFISSPV